MELLQAAVAALCFIVLSFAGSTGGLAHFYVDLSDISGIKGKKTNTNYNFDYN